MLSNGGRLAWWLLFFLNSAQLVNFTINGVDGKWQVWLCGLSSIFALFTLRRDAIAHERFEQQERLAKLDVKR